MLVVESIFLHAFKVSASDADRKEALGEKIVDECLEQIIAMATGHDPIESSAEEQQEAVGEALLGSLLQSALGTGTDLL